MIIDNMQKILTRESLQRLSIILFVILLMLSYFVHRWFSIKSISLIGVMITFLTMFWILYLCKDYIQIKWIFIFDKCHPFRLFIESKAVFILIIFILIVICWFGLDIFMNPYLYEYNHGNGAYCSQVLHNLCSGLGPEHTVKYDAVLFFQSNPYYYASAFSAVPHILPLILLPPLYCLYPYPPMHVFAVVILVIAFGSFGIYLAVRSLKGSKTMALMAAIGFCLLPWVEKPIFMHGHFDVISYAVYPFVFAALFARRWLLFYVSVFLLSTINMPYTYSTMAIGLMIAIFFKAPRQGLIAVVIGFIVMLWDKEIIRESLRGIFDLSMQSSGTLMQLLMVMNFSSFIKAALFHVGYIFLLLMTVSFLPLLGIRRDKDWDWPIIGMLLFAVIGAFMGLFRSYDLASHRNANMVVPIYLSAFMVLTDMCRTKLLARDGDKSLKNNIVLISFLLFSGIASVTFWFSNHYPWAVINGKGILSVNYIKSSPIKAQYNHILAKMREFIPDDASVAYRIDAGIQAYITNRQKSWYLGLHPEGVEYYFIQTKEVVYIDVNLPPWQEYLTKVEGDKNNKLLYKDDRLVIYKNLNPQPIPRLESVLGLDIPLKALVPGKWMR